MYISKSITSNDNPLPKPIVSSFISYLPSVTDLSYNEICLPAPASSTAEVDMLGREQKDNTATPLQDIIYWPAGKDKEQQEGEPAQENNKYPMVQASPEIVQRIRRKIRRGIKPNPVLSRRPCSAPTHYEVNLDHQSSKIGDGFSPECAKNNKKSPSRQFSKASLKNAKKPRGVSRRKTSPTKDSDKSHARFLDDIAVFRRSRSSSPVWRPENINLLTARNVKFTHERLFPAPPQRVKHRSMMRMLDSMPTNARLILLSKTETSKRRLFFHLSSLDSLEEAVSSTIPETVVTA